MDKRKDIASSLFFLAISVIVFIEVAKLPIGTLGAPKIGLWPLIQGGLLAILSSILLGKSMKEKGREKNPFWAGQGAWKRIAVTLGGLVAFGAFYETLGFLISVFLLIAFLSRVIGSMRWWSAATVAITSSLCSYILFGVLLDTPLPAGILGF